MWIPFSLNLLCALNKATPKKRSGSLRTGRTLLAVEALETRELMSVSTLGMVANVGNATKAFTTTGSVSLAGKILGNGYSAKSFFPSADGLNFLNSLSDPTVRSVAVADFTRDLALTRIDLMDIFSRGTNFYTACTPTAIESLELLVDKANSALVSMPDAVQNLAYKVVWNSIAPAYDAGQLLNPYIVSQAPPGKPTAGKTTPNPNCAANQNAAALSLRDGVNNYFQGQVLPDATYNFNGTNLTPTWQGFGNLPLFNGTPTYSDVSQGAANDCSLLSSLAEIAARNPAAIQQMFTDNGDGTYIVRFFHGSTPDYVTVDFRLPMVPKGMPTNDPRNPDGSLMFADTLYAHPLTSLWVALAEKAFVVENGNGWISTDKPGVKSYAAIACYPSDALAALTGLSTDTSVFITVPGVYTNGDAVGEAWNQGKYVVLATNYFASQPVVHNHAYALVGFSGGFYKLYNPWGAFNAQTSTYPTTLYEDAWSMSRDFSWWTKAGAAESAKATTQAAAIFSLSVTAQAGDAAMTTPVSATPAAPNWDGSGGERLAVPAIPAAPVMAQGEALARLARTAADAVFADLFAEDAIPLAITR